MFDAPVLWVGKVDSSLEAMDILEETLFVFKLLSFLHSVEVNLLQWM